MQDMAPGHRNASPAEYIVLKGNVIEIMALDGCPTPEVNDFPLGSFPNQDIHDSTHTTGCEKGIENHGPATVDELPCPGCLGCGISTVRSRG
jgi:hypothetical protein